MNLRGRLKRLEKDLIPLRVDLEAQKRRFSLELLFRETDNARSVLRGEDEVPITAEEREHEFEEDRRFFDHGLTTYRNDPGWQTAEAQTLLDAWERDLKERI